MGNDMADMEKDMDGILPRAIYCDIVVFRDMDITHGLTSIMNNYDVRRR